MSPQLVHFPFNEKVKLAPNIISLFMCPHNLMVSHGLKKDQP